MEKNNKPLYKVTFTIKENVKIQVLADTLDKAFDIMGIQFFRYINGNNIEYHTYNRNNYADMWDAIYEILESKYLTYIRGVTWNNYETNNEEDVLTEFLEDHKEDKNGDKQ